MDEPCDPLLLPDRLLPDALLPDRLLLPDPLPVPAVAGCLLPALSDFLSDALSGDFSDPLSADFSDDVEASAAFFSPDSDPPSVFMPLPTLALLSARLSLR